MNGFSWLRGYNMATDIRKRYGKTGLLVAIILLFVIDIFNMTWQRHKIAEDKRKRQECTESVSVTISEVKSKKRTTSIRRNKIYRRDYNFYEYYAIGTYTVDGEEYAFSLPKTDNKDEYYEGKEYILKYNKDNVADYYIVGNNASTDKFVFALIRIAVYIVILVVIAINDSKGKVRQSEAGNFRRVSSGSGSVDDDTWDPFNGI